MTSLVRRTAFLTLSGVALALATPSSAPAHPDLESRIAAVSAQMRVEPGSAALYLRRGELNREHESWDAALADYDAAAKLDPGLAAVDLARGKALFGAGRMAEAKAALDAYLARKPSSTEGYTARSRTLRALGDLDGCAADMGRAVGVAERPAPEDILEQANAIEALGTDSREDALRAVEAGLARIGRADSLELAALDLERKLGRTDAALARIDRLSASANRAEQWLARRGDVLAAGGRTAEAHAAYSTALAAVRSLPDRLRSVAATRELEARLEATTKTQPR